MVKTQVYSGVILALVLLYSNPVFAGHGPAGDEGMLSAGEMRAVIKAGGSFSSPNGSGSGGGMVATIPTKNIDGSTTSKTYSAGEVHAIVSPSFSNTQVGADLRATAGQARTAGTSTDSHYGLGRGHSDAMGSAVNALRGGSSPASQPVVIGGQTYQIIGVAPANQPGWSVTNPNYKGNINAPLTISSPYASTRGVSDTTIAYVQNKQSQPGTTQQTTYTKDGYALSGPGIATGEISAGKSTGTRGSGTQSLADALKGNTVKYSGSNIPGATTTAIKTNTGATNIYAPVNRGNNGLSVIEQGRRIDRF